MLDVHVVSHTHWDREWYLPAERFRQRLVALIDELIDDPPDGNESFLLDGQAIVLEDYVRVRPERADALRRLLHEGRLEAGPWYVLADELIPSGEALIRNLQAGRRTLRRFDADAPPALYCPDSFGHPAALPAIAAGFGFAVVVLLRGYGSRRFPPGDAARWRAPNGDMVILYHLPPSGYELASNLPTEPDLADSRWASMREQLAPRSTTGVVLLPHGADHHARQLGHREALNAIETAGARDGVHRSSLRAFASALAARGARETLPVVDGELRDSYGYTWTLQGTFATRAHEKRLNALAERALVREAEPWNALAARRGRSRRHLLDEAWRTLLEAHPHDTLCGCSIDEVAAAMELRVRSAANQAAGVRDDSVHDLIGHDAAQARMSKERWHPIVVVRNPAPRVRSGVAIIDVEDFVADVRVGSGSAPSGAPPEYDAHTKPPAIAGLGRVQVLSRTLRHSRIESPRHYPDDDLVAVSRIAAWVGDAPSYGIVAHPVARRAHGGARPTDRVTTTPRSLSNGSVRVAVQDDGSISLENLAGGRRIVSLVQFEDDADVGDLYTPAPRPRPCRFQVRSIRRPHRGPLRGEIEIGGRVVDPDVGRAAGAIELTMRLVLDAGSSFVRVEVEGENQRADHRLRIVFATDVAAPEVWADAAFGPVMRRRIRPTADETVAEHAPPTAPLHRYVSLFTASRGASVISDGLAEYETRDDGSIAIALVRAVGELSRNDLPERPGHAGWPASTPGAQCLGPFTAAFAIMLHGTRDAATIDAIERAADDALLPITGTTLRSALAVPDAVVGPELIGAGLAVSAIKESDDGEWTVLRCANLLNASTNGSWRLPFAIADARLARLDETSVSAARIVGNEVVFDAGPRAIVTILVR